MAIIFLWPLFFVKTPTAAPIPLHRTSPIHHASPLSASFHPKILIHMLRSRTKIAIRRFWAQMPPNLYLSRSPYRTMKCPVGVLGTCKSTHRLSQAKAFTHTRTTTLSDRTLTRVSVLVQSSIKQQIAAQGSMIAQLNAVLGCIVVMRKRCVLTRIVMVSPCYLNFMYGVKDNPSTVAYPVKTYIFDLPFSPHYAHRLTD
jgi:hypothetical protein